jgi:CheY-like chemotaxis protein
MRSNLPSILLVDDDPDAVFLTSRLLTKAGISNPVVVVNDGEEAISYLSRIQNAAPRTLPALVLLDIKMPMLDGFKVLRWIKKERNLPTVRVVILTTSADHGDQQRAENLGADAYIVKYPSPGAMSQVIRATLAAPPKVAAQNRI